MKFTAEIPVLVEAKTPKAQTAKPSFVLIKTDFEIHDMDEDDATLAFIVSQDSYKTTKEIRAYGDKLFCSTSASLEEFIERAFHAFPLSKTLLFTEVITKAKREAAQLGSGIVPSGAPTILAKDHKVENPYDEKDLKFIESARKLGARIEITDEVQAVTNTYADIIKEKLTAYILIGGQIYQRSGEPVYKAGSAGNSLFFTDIGRMNNAGDFTFSAESYDEFRAHIQDRDVGSASGLHIEIVDGSYLSWKAEEMDLDVFCRSLEANVRINCSKLYGNISHEGPVITSPIMRADAYANEHLPSWKEFKKVLHSYNPMKGEPVSPQLEGLVASLINEIKYHDDKSDTNGKIHGSLDYEMAEKYISRVADSVININLMGAKP